MSDSDDSRMVRLQQRAISGSDSDSDEEQLEVFTSRLKDVSFVTIIFFQILLFMCNKSLNYLILCKNCIVNNNIIEVRGTN